MKSAARRLAAPLAGLALIAIAVHLAPRRQGSGTARENREGERPSSALTEKSRSSGIARLAAADDDRTGEPLRSITSAAAALRESPDAGPPASILRDLGKRLRSGDPAAVSSALRTYLESGDDADTGLPFSVSAGGNLGSAPGLRMFLLDMLPSVDPELALAVSREVMDRRTSADEYAIALRNLAWSDLDGDLAAEFAERFSRMVREKPWRERAAPGFLETMDAALLLPPDEGAAILLEVKAAATDQPRLSRACMIALDRIVTRDPSLLAALDLGDLDPEQRASLMSRLDLTDAPQRARFTAYLGSLPEGAEMEQFASLFPNGNLLHGNRLFSAPARPPSIAERRKRDEIALTELSALGFPPGTPAAAALARIRERIGNWLGEAE